MKHSLEERMDIGRRMYLHEITYKEAMEIYGLSESCAHKYMTDYKKAQGIPLANTVPKMKNLQCVVSDMTAFHLKGSYYELTLFMDLWNNEILSYSPVCGSLGSVGTLTSLRVATTTSGALSSYRRVTS